MSIIDYQDHIPVFGSNCYFGKNSLVIGQVRAGDDVSFWPSSVTRGDVNYISIGNRTNIQDLSVLHCTHNSKYNPGGFPLIIGDDVTIGHHVNLHGCTIKDACLIGIGAIVLDNCTLEKYTYIAAGSLVPPNKKLESGYLWMGNPIKKHRRLTEKEIEFIYYSAKHYVKLKNNYLVKG